MLITEILTLVNADKTFMGPRDIKLTLDTDTGRLSIDTPAMFRDPVVSFIELQEKIAKLAEYA